MGLSKDILEDWVLSNIKKFDKKLVGDPVNGTRKISGQLFSPPDTIMAASKTSSYAEFASTHPDLEIPLNLYSIQAFEFIGLTTKTSERLLQAWITGDNFK